MDQKKHQIKRDQLFPLFSDVCNHQAPSLTQFFLGNDFFMSIRGFKSFEMLPNGTMTAVGAKCDENDGTLNGFS